MSNDQRWKQRFSNFEKAFLVFQRRIEEYRRYPLQEAYQMALIQAFEIIIELSWKTLKDYLENQGYNEIKNGKQAIRQAFQDAIIADATVWMKALEIRNETSHTYNPEIMKKVVLFLEQSFDSVLESLYQALKRFL